MAPLVMRFSDDILAEIFIRLPTLEDLGRACASCPAFRSVITSQSFLRRLHALRPPSLLGFRSLYAPFYPAEPPHPCAPAARAVAEAADFNFSFLPIMRIGFWVVSDARDGRFVLECNEGDATLTTIAVCDPLFRRYKLLPPLPEDLAAAGRQLFQAHRGGDCRYDIFLAPCDQEAEGAPGAFCVIWMAQFPTKLMAFIFSSVSWQWQTIASRGWHDLNPIMSPVMRCPPLLWCRRSYAYGCFYWYLSGFYSSNKLIVLDMGKMEFYPVNYPSNHGLERVAIVKLGDNRRGMFVLGTVLPHNEDYIVRLFSASNQIHGEGATDEWVLENTVSLSVSNNFSMLGVADGKLLLHGAREHNSEEEYGCISLDFKTGLVQRFRGIICCGFCPSVAQYIGYPPSLSLPTI